ncbi:type II toxin-antitoxin system VapC family toxin [Telmatobacter bradus]|uniref:type II toxin-antitoxin system VapC family toxin n=1 Tax=Telmatobacter bradus TaxID=474953 RepID=UPI003B42F70A
MFLVDTNVISELRKGAKADAGVVHLLNSAETESFLAAQTVGELRQGVENLRFRGDHPQADRLEVWLKSILEIFASRILPFDRSSAEIWGAMMGPNAQNPIDKQIAAIARQYDLTVVTRNVEDFAGTGVRVLNPFLADVPSEETNA